MILKWIKYLSMKRKFKKLGSTDKRLLAYLGRTPDDYKRMYLTPPKGGNK